MGGTTLGEAAEALPSLLWPPLEHQSDDDSETEERVEVEVDGDAHTLGSLGLVIQLCMDTFHDSGRIDFTTRYMAQQVAEKMDTMPQDWKSVNPYTIAAACMYTASYLTFQGKTFAQVSTMSGINADLIRKTYEVIYSVREQLVQEFWFEGLMWTRENALYCLPKP